MVSQRGEKLRRRSQMGITTVARATEVSAFIGLGSNLGDRTGFIDRSIKLLQETPGVVLTRVSRLQETRPLGPIKQPDFLNGVARIRTLLEPIDLLDVLLGIEKQLGRVRKERWGPRTIDLDIILYGDKVIDHPRLRVPHPELPYRPFWLAGLREVGGSFVVIPLRHSLRPLAGNP